MHSISIDMYYNGTLRIGAHFSESDSQFNNDSGWCFGKCRNENNAYYAGFNILGSCFNQTLSLTDRETHTHKVTP